MPLKLALLISLMVIMTFGLDIEQKIKALGLPMNIPVNSNLEDQQHKQPQDPFLTSCTDSITNAVNQVVASCEHDYVSKGDIVQCFQSVMRGYTGQAWNIFLRYRSSEDSLSYWHFFNCRMSYSYSVYYSYVYLLYPAVGYSPPNNQQIAKPNPQLTAFQSNFSHKNSQPSPLMTNMPESECQKWRQIAVANVLVLCDIKGNGDAAQCISNRLKKTLNENWGVYVSSDYESSANGAWAYEVCSLKFQNYGTYKRGFQIWLAQS